MDWQTIAQTPTPKTRAQIQREYRSGDKGQAARRRERLSDNAKESRRAMRERQWLAKPFVAWDGEGVSREDGSHDYLLLANSDGHSIRHLKKLSTTAIFEFAFNHSRPGTTNVIYGAGYDWNCWLSDFTREEMKTLYDEQEIRWRGYFIKWRRGKTFHIMSGKRKVLFYDVVSFFQTSFVNACDSYLGDGFVDREMIVENKMLRSGFRPSDLDDIAVYNRAELVNLVKLMNNLRERLYRADLRPSRWDGPGAIAVALMSREKIPNHKQDHPQKVMPAIRHAYYGGRFEVVRFGHVEKRAYEYDINSAYPWALLNVPTLKGGKWQYVKGDPGRRAYALYMLEYDGREVMRPDRPQPLPRRHYDGTVTYPLHVRGWYWTPEYDTAKEYVKQYGGKLKVKAAWVFTPVSREKPFAYVATEFAKRRILKANGDGAHVGIKLGLNSQYGKLAQQVGWTTDKDGTLRIPPYHQLDWAGYVTSTCRAEVLRAGMQNLDAVIAWETDALFTSEPLELKLGGGLGEWERTEFADLTYLQSGMYFATDSEGKRVEKTRGVDKGSLTREMVLDALNSNADHVPAQLTRFTGVGLALQTDWEKWRHWETTPKSIALFPDGKRVHPSCPICIDAGGFGIGKWHTTQCIARPGFKSAEYVVGWIKADNEQAALRMSHYESEIFSDM